MNSTTTSTRLRAALADVDYPASREQLLEHATRNGADEDTLRALWCTPPDIYVNFQQLLHSVPVDQDHDHHAGRSSSGG